MNRFAETSVVVTGGARGIGLSIARRFLREGARVLICDTHESALQEAMQELGAASDAVRTVVCNVANADEVGRMVDTAAQHFGGVSVLVNNAGISPKHEGVRAAIDRVSEAEWRGVLDVNLTGAFLCARAVLPLMKARSFGRIVNVASLAGRTRSDVAGAHYASSKAGMMSLARSLAAEAGGHGITANSVAPGRIETAMALEAGAAVNDEYLSRIPVGRLGTPEDVASAVAFLASAEAGFISGVTLDVNGGSFMI